VSFQLLIQTTVPLFSLILIGYLSRRFRVLEEGDERVFSNYLYWIGLPALLLIDIAEIEFTTETVRYVGVSMIPLVFMFTVVLLVGKITGLDGDILRLLLITSSFGNLGFFGVAFVDFAFNTIEAETLAALIVSSVNTVGFIVAFVLLESLGGSEKGIITKTIGNLSKNPLIISIIIGLGFNILFDMLPGVLSSFLHMIASSVSPVAIYMLGVSIYGKEMGDLRSAAIVSSIRLVVLPGLALLVSRFFELPLLETSIMVIMYGTPLALSMVILSKRYDFLNTKVSSVVMLSSLVSGVTLNIWLFILERLF
jgi:predicted permease